MGTTDADRRQTLARGILIAAGALIVVGIGAWLWMMQPPPQLANDPDVFETVDALFTAVTSRNEKQLSDCEARLKSYRESGKLSPAADRSLGAVIRQARSGAWEPAAQALYTFMLGQRREGQR